MQLSEMHGAGRINTNYSDLVLVKLAVHPTDKSSSLDTGRKLNFYETFKGRPGHLLRTSYVRLIYSLCPED